MSSWCQYEALKYVSFPTQVLAKENIQNHLNLIIIIFYILSRIKRVQKLEEFLDF